MRQSCAGPDQPRRQVGPKAAPVRQGAKNPIIHGQLRHSSSPSLKGTGATGALAQAAGAAPLCASPRQLEKRLAQRSEGAEAEEPSALLAGKMSQDGPFRASLPSLSTSWPTD